MRITGLLILIMGVLLFSADGNGFAAGIGDIQPKLPPQLPSPLQVTSLALNKTSVVAGSVDSDITGTVLLNLKVPQNIKITVKLSISPLLIEAGTLAFPEVSDITIPEGRAEGAFRIKTNLNPSYASPTQCTLTAALGQSKKTTGFTVEQLRISSLSLFPPAGLGPFTATGTVSLNAAPAANTTVTLTSSPPDVVRFGTIGSAQSTLALVFNNTGNSKTFSVVAASVPKTASFTIKATLNKQEVSSQITVRSVP